MFVAGHTSSRGQRSIFCTTREQKEKKLFIKFKLMEVIEEKAKDETPEIKEHR